MMLPLDAYDYSQVRHACSTTTKAPANACVLAVGEILPIDSLLSAPIGDPVTT